MQNKEILISFIVGILVGMVILAAIISQSKMDEKVLDTNKRVEYAESLLYNYEERLDSIPFATSFSDDTDLGEIKFLYDYYKPHSQSALGIILNELCEKSIE